MEPELLRVFREGLPLESIGPFERVGPDQFPLSAASPLRAEHEALGPMLAAGNDHSKAARPNPIWHAAAATDVEALVQAQMGPRKRTDVETSYDAVADEYVRRIFDELRDKPLDRSLLDRFAASVRDVGPVCDVGCGPGHVARYLHERGVRVSGIDLSPAMVTQARRLNPGVEFRHADMMALDAPDGAWAGIVAFYSVIHFPRPELARALSELRRVLRPGGVLLLAFHVGDGAVHLEEWWGHKVSVDFFFFQPADVADDLRSAGFAVQEIIERDPYPGVEHPSRRAYIFATKPGGGT